MHSLAVKPYGKGVMTFEAVTGREQTSPSTGEHFLCVRPEPGRLEDEETGCPVAAGPSWAGRPALGLPTSRGCTPMELPTGSSGNWQCSRGRGCGASLSHTQTPPGPCALPGPVQWQDQGSMGPSQQALLSHLPAGPHLGAPGPTALLSTLHLPWACPQADPCLVVRKGRRSCLACMGRTCSGTTWSEATGRCTCPSHPDGRSSFRPGPSPGHARLTPGHASP